MRIDSIYDASCMMPAVFFFTDVSGLLSVDEVIVNSSVFRLWRDESLM